METLSSNRSKLRSDSGILNLVLSLSAGVGGRSDGLTGLIEFVDFVGVWRDVNRITVFDPEFAVGANRQQTGVAGADMQEGVRPQMLGNADLALPLAFRGGQGE